MKQIAFLIILLITLAIFSYTLRNLIKLFRLTQGKFEFDQIGKRVRITLQVAIGQNKILRKPVIGFLHAMVFWGFIIITIGSLEMIVDGVLRMERTFAFMGVSYDVIIGLGDFFAYFILFGILLFLFRRLFLNIKRFKGEEIKRANKLDANIALSIILLLMISLIGINISYVVEFPTNFKGSYPISELFASFFNHNSNIHLIHEINWWVHILAIFFFANYLPYSKHFHVFMSIPNVFFSNLKPLSFLPNMESVTNEVKLMLNPSAPVPEEETPAKFGVNDIEDVSPKNYMDALSCTQCGRCTDVCPANITGKKLSPRKIFVDLRNRMSDKGLKLIKDSEYSDNKSLLNSISKEELWACTSCNACAQECPLNISHPNLIMDMRRFLVMELGEAPSELNTMFANIENNGAPWQYSQEDRLEWTKE